PRYEELLAAADADPGLREAVAGELISSEIEIISGAGANLSAALAAQRERRGRLFALAASHGVELGATGTHPWADYREQPIIDTEHYHRVEEGLKYVAWRNNTFSLHVHVGVKGADRAIAVCDRVREVLPELLAISASSPFTEGVDSGLASSRSQHFTRMFPRCGIPDPFNDWKTYQDFVEFLVRTDSIVESTQLWWSVRPHHLYGTVEVRICDAQPSGHDGTALAGLITACVAQAARDFDENRPFTPKTGRQLEENLWRAIRFGLDGKLIDLDRGEEYPAVQIAERLLTWTAPVRAELGIEPNLPEQGATSRLREAAGDSPSAEKLRDVFAASLQETAATYTGSAVPSGG
ncbi:MAG TPA: YbdK family carboxylate-amine ligase, partial [Solirubrobacterales bacterium]|nr:YbdK family carboxylate-amine ligase [Solirubrobacterales bacterium]